MAPTVRLVHGGLVTHWLRARALLEENREALRTRDRLEMAAADWRMANHDPEYLLPKGRRLLDAGFDCNYFVAAHQRRSATQAQIASITPKGQCPLQKPVNRAECTAPADAKMNPVSRSSNA